jgi:hypothetical protein
MEYVHYLIYPIAGFLCLMALGGLSHSSKVVKAASLFSLFFNGFAIIQFVWWPIPVSLISDFVFKRVFGDPGPE